MVFRGGVGLHLESADQHRVPTMPPAGDCQPRQMTVTLGGASFTKGALFPGADSGTITMLSAVFAARRPRRSQPAPQNDTNLMLCPTLRMPDLITWVEERRQCTGQGIDVVSFRTAIFVTAALPAGSPCATPVPTRAKLEPLDHANARPPRRRLCAASRDQPTSATRPTHRARPA